jgi:hypothetical protein
MNMSDRTLVEQLRDVGNDKSSKPICQKVFSILHDAENCFSTPCDKCNYVEGIANRIETEYTPNSVVDSEYIKLPKSMNGKTIDPRKHQLISIGGRVAREDWGYLTYDNEGRAAILTGGCWEALCDCEIVEPPNPLTKEDIDAMVKMTCGDYWQCNMCDDCTECPSKIDGKMPDAYYGVDDCYQAKILDILRKERERVAGGAE